MEGCGGMVRPIGFLKRLWMVYRSKPAGERSLLAAVGGIPARPDGSIRVMELGLGTLRRAERVLRLASSRKDRPSVHYVGLDRFEGRLPSDPPGVTLKQAHQALGKLARVQLVPGNVDTSLSRLCNHLGTFDLVIVSGDADPRHLERSWFFIQRLVTPTTAVYVEPSAADAAWLRIDKARVDELATIAVGRRVA